MCGLGQSVRWESALAIFKQGTINEELTLLLFVDFQYTEVIDQLLLLVLQVFMLPELGLLKSLSSLSIICSLFIIE